MNVLVTGGAGYIGSHMIKALQCEKHNVVCLDNLSTGHRDLVLCDEFIEGDLEDRALLKEVFNKNDFDAVVHFAAFSQVAESVRDPSKYYTNNISNTQNLLDEMVSSNVKNIVFSSTAAIFGEPKYIPIDEKHSKAPLSPYGRTKLAIEHMLGDYEAAYGIRSIVLRYFNAAGCDPDAKIGERHMPETHLIPIVLQVASGRRKDVSIYGTDYHTPDGTCIRDYIHVLDLCEAHILSLNWLLSGGISKCYNLGNGSGFSVKEVIDAVVKVTGKSVQTIDAEKRSGDPEVLVSDSLLIQQELGWLPKYSSLETLVDHAWRWEIQENRKNQ